MDLLQKMLEFNPYLRPSARELLEHKYFDPIRVSTNESSAKEKLCLEIDSDVNFDPSTCEFKWTNEQLLDKIHSLLGNRP